MQPSPTFDSEVRKRRHPHTSHHQVKVLFIRGCGNAFRQAASVVFGETVLPLQEIGDGLGLDAHFNAPQTGEQQVHLFPEADFAAQIGASRFDRHAHIASS